MSSSGLFSGAAGGAGGGFPSGLPIIGEVFGFLTEIFSQAQQIADLARVTDQVEQQAWANTINLAGWAYGTFGDVIGTLGDAVKKIGDALWHVLRDIIWGHIKALFDAIRKWIENLRNWIKVHVGILKNIQKQLDAARAKQMKLIIDITKRIRKILLPFRLLHLRFATLLDERLVGFESDLGAKWAKMIERQNLIQTTLDAVIDPRKLLRPGNALGSMGEMIGAVHGAVGALDVRSLFCMNPFAPAQPVTVPWSTTSAVTLQQIATNSGDYGAAVVQRDQMLAQYEQDLGLTLTP